MTSSSSFWAAITRRSRSLFFAVLFSFPLVTIVIMHDTTVANLRPKHPWWVLVRTVSGTIVGFCAFYAFTHLPLAETYSILFITPLLITMLSIPLLGETVRLRRWAAVIVGLVGVMIVLQPGQAHLGLGHLAALTAAVVFLAGQYHRAQDRPGRALGGADALSDAVELPGHGGDSGLRLPADADRAYRRLRRHGRARHRRRPAVHRRPTSGPRR